MDSRILKVQRLSGVTLTSARLFFDLAEDACNWSGVPLLNGNVRTNAALRGNITQLKKFDLIETVKDADRHNDTWVHFTEKGQKLALEIGIDVRAEW